MQNSSVIAVPSSKQDACHLWALVNGVLHYEYLSSLVFVALFWCAGGSFSCFTLTPSRLMKCNTKHFSFQVFLTSSIARLRLKLKHSGSETEIKIYEQKIVLQDFFSLSNIWDFETALWKNRDCKMHIATKKRLRDLWNSMTHGFKGTIHQPWHISLNISFFHIQVIFLTLYYVLIIGCLENLNCKVTLFSTGSTLASSKSNYLSVTLTINCRVSAI